MGYRTIANPTRGCGHLKEGGTYLLGCEKSKDGCLPAFVEFDPPIPTLEGHFRGFEYVNGLQFLLIHRPREAYRGRAYNIGLAKNNHKALGMSKEMPFSEIEERLLTELDRALERAKFEKGRIRVSSMNFQGHITMPQVHAQDILMYVGESYYATPDDFIEEAYNLGISKRVQALPNCIWPGHTRIFFAHMKCIPDKDDPEDVKKRTPGVFGYAYLQQAIWVKPKKKKVPDKMLELHKLGKLEIVNASEVPEDDDDNGTLDDFEGE